MSLVESGASPLPAGLQARASAADDMQNGAPPLPLPYSKPPPELLAELEEVAEAARGLVDALRAVNQMPEGFPKPQVEEIARALTALPEGTAEGARDPLRYAHERLGEIRRVYMARATGDELAPFARDGFIDERVGRLYLAIGTARHQLAATADEEFDEELLPPIMGPAPDAPFVDTAHEAAAELERSAAANRETVRDLARPDSKPADDAARQFRDVETTAEIAKAEFGLADRNQVWRRRFAVAIEKAPALISKSLRGLRRGIDIAERCWTAWDDFQRTGVGAMFDLARKLADIASQEFEKTFPSASSPQDPPADFDLDEAHRLILAGREPPASWRPWIIELNFTDRNLSDLAPVARLRNLQSLSADGAQFKELAPIAGLEKLETLSLNGVNVNDLAPIGSLKNLRTLWLDNTQVSDLAPIRSLENLRTLWIDNTQVSDLGPIKSLENLRTLTFNSTQVSDLAPIANLENLESLMLEDTQVSDLAPIRNLSALQLLRLSSTPISDLAPIADLEHLNSIHLDHTQVSDLTPLARLVNLQSLRLNNTHINDLAPISGLKNLVLLYFEDTQVSDLRPIEHLVDLESLRLSNTRAKDLSPIGNLINLQSLYLSQTQITDLTPLARLENLDALYLNYTQIDDLSSIGELKSLRTLWFDSTRISDLAPIKSLEKLETLSLDHTQISDLAPITSLENLRTLWLVGTEVVSLAPLASLVQLESVWVESEERRAALAASLPERSAIVKVRLWGGAS